jgi:hypothetical protein
VVVGSNPAIYWMDVSDASYCIFYIYKSLGPRKKNPQQKKERAAETKLNTKPKKKKKDSYSYINKKWFKDIQNKSKQNFRSIIKSLIT